MKKKGLFDHVVDALAFMAGILLTGTVLIVCFEVCMRYFIHKPQVWTVEICEYFLFGIAFLGTAWLLREGGHVTVDVVTERISSKARNYLHLFSTALGILISFIICCFALVTAWDCYKSKVVLTKTLTIPKHYFLLLIFLGYFLLLLQFSRQFLRWLKEIIGEK